MQENRSVSTTGSEGPGTLMYASWNNISVSGPACRRRPST